MYKTFIDVKLLLTMFHKVDWFIRYYDGTKFSVLFDRLVGLKLHGLILIIMQKLIELIKMMICL